MNTNSVKNTLIASLIAGATSELSVIPICTIQTNYQSQKNLHTHRISISNITKTLYKNHGLKGFYNSSFSGILSQVVSTGSKFTIYEIIKNYRQNDISDIKNNTISGGLAGILSIVFTQPFDVAKNYHQRQRKFIPDIIKNPKILYRGSLQSLSKSLILMSVLYPVNDLCRSHVNDFIEEGSLLKPAISGFMTTVIISPLVHPVDLLKRRAMAGEKLWMGFNPIHYYRGLFINWLRATPHFMVTMITIDSVKKYLSN